jgi:hypothetical protein
MLRSYLPPGPLHGGSRRRTVLPADSPTKHIAGCKAGSSSRKAAKIASVDIRSNKDWV